MKLNLKWFLRLGSLLISLLVWDYPENKRANIVFVVNEYDYIGSTNVSTFVTSNLYLPITTDCKEGYFTCIASNVVTRETSN